MRYQVLQLLQLLFALSLIIGAFAGGIVVGWWRWGRARSVTSGDNEGRLAGLRALFSPEGRDDEIVLTDYETDMTNHGVVARVRGAEGVVFATAPTSQGRWTPPPWSEPSVPPAAIGPPADQHVTTSETLDA